MIMNLGMDVACVSWVGLEDREWNPAQGERNTWETCARCQVWWMDSCSVVRAVPCSSAARCGASALGWWAPQASAETEQCLGERGSLFGHIPLREQGDLSGVSSHGHFKDPLKTTDLENCT